MQAGVQATVDKDIEGHGGNFSVLQSSFFPIKIRQICPMSIVTDEKNKDLGEGNICPYHLYFARRTSWLHTMSFKVKIPRI